MLIVLIGVVGLAVDGAIAFGYSVSIERAAAAGALAGVPYLPGNFNGTAPSASSRALDEVKRNGYDPSSAGCRCTVTMGTSNAGKNLTVQIRQTVPTFFMQALGVAPFPITRTAEAGFRPPINLGSPDNEFGSTVSEIGASGHFYVLRQKAWHVSAGRGEGDAYTPDPSNPYEISTSGANPATTDVHAISRSQGNESADPNFTGAFPGGWNDRGGENFRVTVPAGTTGELQVYNAGFGPDKGNATQNYCENWVNFLGVNKAIKCNASTGQTLAEDDGLQAQCSGNCSGQRSEYNTVMYTLFQVNDEFVRANDTELLQTKVFPVDASNYDKSPPTYVSAKDGTVITQTYDLFGRPTNMKTYHSWTNITTEPTGTIVQRTGFGICASGCPSLGPGSYRLRVDLLDNQGNFANVGSSNHAYAIRIVQPGTQPETASTGAVCSAGGTKCTAAGWEDAVAYTPLTKSGDNYIPLFQLPKEYAGSIIDVDLFDFGDVSGTNDVAVIDPTQAGCTPSPCDASPFGGVANGTGVQITDNGVNRGGGGGGHVCGPNSQCPSGTTPSGSPDDVPHLIGANYAAWNVATSSSHPYNGTWIRVTIPIPGNYNPGANDFWYVRYTLSGTAGDTFSWAVAARGGPVHLLGS